MQHEIDLAESDAQKLRRIAASTGKTEDEIIQGFMRRFFGNTKADRTNSPNVEQIRAKNAPKW